MRSASPLLAAQAAARLGRAARARPPAPDRWDAVERLLADASVSGRSRAALLAALGPAWPASRSLAMLPRERDDDVRAALLASVAAHAAGDQARAARAALEADLGSPRRKVALAAAAGLARLGDDRALPVLREVLRAGNGEERLAAVAPLAALARQGIASARLELTAVVDDRDSNVAARAATALDDLLRTAPAPPRRRFQVGWPLAAAAALAGAAATTWLRRRAAKLTGKSAGS